MGRKNVQTRVGPSSSDEQLEQPIGNSSFELDLMSDLARKNKSNNPMNNFKNVVKETQDKRNALKALTFVKASGTKWRNYCSTRRKRKYNKSLPHGKVPQKDHGLDGLGLDEELESSLQKNYPPKHGTTHHGEKENSTTYNQLILQYFAKLGKTKTEDAMIDLDYVEALLQRGANVNCADKYGQTLLHEVARAWHIDVAKFLIFYGAEVNNPDSFGRTPLHVAAAADYAEMVNFLIKNGADKDAQTKNELQSPVHYAAKKDACMSLRALIKNKCEYRHVWDYKGRTPLHVAAELDRSESARLLLNLDVPVGVSDDRGQKTITWMITKMPPVAMEALNQFHSTDRPNRKQHFHLNYLMQDREKDKEGFTQTPLQVAVNYKQYDLLMHKVFLCLINTMWTKFTRMRAWRDFVINFITILSWSVIGVVVEYDKKHDYIMPDHWWRIVLLLLAIGLTVFQIVEEVLDYLRSLRLHKNWKLHRIHEIEEDEKYCHNQWPEEGEFLISEKVKLDKLRPKYFNDYWNIFDWICYVMLLLCISTHLVDIFDHSINLALAHIRLMSITIILLWLRLMKNARAFALLGPFIVMLGHMLTDLVKFLFLYLEFFLPYVCAFWMIFGGTKLIYENSNTASVSGFGNFGEVFFTLFRLTLVDDYDFDNMQLVDSFMAYLLVGTWLALSAILCLNLFIALLSETFQRVYDNAQANAVMQKAITILSVWEKLSKNQQKDFYGYISKHCSPLTEDYDDDVTDGAEEDLKKVTVQIKEQLDEMQEMWVNKFGNHESTEFENTTHDDSGGGDEDEQGMKYITKQKFEEECIVLKESILELSDRQEAMMTEFKNDMSTVKSLLIEIGGRGPRGGFAADSDIIPSERTSHRKKVYTSSREIELPGPYQVPSDAAVGFLAVSVPQITQTTVSRHSKQDPDSDSTY